MLVKQWHYECEEAQIQQNLQPSDESISLMLKCEAMVMLLHLDQRK